MGVSERDQPQQGGPGRRRADQDRDAHGAALAGAMTARA
jgi:hypothetical protein